MPSTSSGVYVLPPPTTAILMPIPRAPVVNALTTLCSNAYKHMINRGQARPPGRTVAMEETRWPGSGLSSGPSRSTTRSISTCAAMIDDGRWPRGPPGAAGARARAPVRRSLITVRRALDELAREQRIERTRGRGTFVLAPRIDRDLDEPLSFSEEMQRRGLNPQTRLIAARPEMASERVAAALELEPGSPTLFVERLRLADGDPFLLEQAHLPAERFPGLLGADLETSSLYGILSERYGTHVARTRETFEPIVLRTPRSRSCSASSRARRPSSSRASRSLMKASRSSSRARSCAATARATTSNAPYASTVIAPAAAGREANHDHACQPAVAATTHRGGER